MNLFGLKISLPGEGTARRAQEAMTDLTNQEAATYKKYMPEMLQSLYGLYTNPDTGYNRAQMNTFGTNTLNNYKMAAGQLSQNLAARGLGQSSYTQNGLGSLWQGYGQTMANAQMQNMGNLEQQRMQALQALLGVASGAQQNAMGGYGQLYKIGQEQQQHALGDIGDIAKFLMLPGVSGAISSGLGSIGGSLFGGTAAAAGAAGAAGAGAAGTIADVLPIMLA